MKPLLSRIVQREENKAAGSHDTIAFELRTEKSTILISCLLRILEARGREGEVTA